MAKTPASQDSATAEPSTTPKDVPPPAEQPATTGAQATAPAKAARPSISRLRHVSELFGVGLLALGLGIGGTWLWSTLKVNKLNELHQSELQQATALMDERLQARAADILLLNAHRSLHRCVVALDQHNFGTARAHAKQAAQQLQQATARLEGQPDHAHVAKAQQALKRISPEVTADVGGQRAKFLAVAEQLDAVLTGRSGF